MTKLPARSSLAAGALAALLSCGCTSRTMTVTSLPPGAEVTINHRNVGVTPVRVGYTHYGEYQVVLRKERYETAVRTVQLRTPLYAYDPISFIADNLLPMRIVDECLVHAVLDPAKEEEGKVLMDRAEAAAKGLPTLPAGGQVEVSEFVALLARDPSPPAVAEAPTKKDPDGKDPAPKTLPPELQAPEGIAEKPPEGPRLSPELVAPPRPKEVKPPRFERVHPGPKRTAKPELVIYDDPPLKNPD